MKLKNKLIPLIAGLALLCPLAICQHNANASEENTYYNNGSYNNQPRQPYDYYYDTSDEDTGSTAGSYEKNYTGTEPHDTEVKSALNLIHNNLGYNSNVESTNDSRIDERMEYTPDPVDLKMYYYNYDSTIPSNKSSFYSMSDAQFNKGDTVNMSNMIKQSGDSTVNIMHHPNDFTITKNTIISIPVSEQVNAMINVTPITENGGYDGPTITIYHLQPNQQFNISNYLENHGYNPINKNEVITVPNGLYEGLTSNYKIPVESNNFDPNEIDSSFPSSLTSSSSPTCERTVNYPDWASNLNIPSSSTNSVSLSSSVNSSNSSYSLPNSQLSNVASNLNSSQNYNNLDNISNDNHDSSNYKSRPVIKHKKVRKHFNNRLNKITHNIIKHGRKRIRSSRHIHKKRKHYSSHKIRYRVRYRYVSRRRYRNLMRYRKNLYHKSRRLRHRSKRYKHYKKIINKLNHQLKHLRIRK